MKQSLILKPSIKYGIIYKIKLSKIFEEKESEFNKIIQEIESSPIFIKLLNYAPEGKKIIKYNKFPNSGTYLRFYELKEERIHDGTIPEIESLLDDTFIQKIRDIGYENFKKYFIENENNLSPEEISKICSIPYNEVIKINNFLNTLYVKEEFYTSSLKNIKNNYISYTRVASIQINENRDNIVIDFISPAYSKGLYVIDFDKLQELKQSGYFNEDELKQLKTLIENIKIINERKRIIYKLLTTIGLKQFNYLNTGDISNLTACSMLQISKEIETDISVISKLVKYKTVITPWNEEIKITDLMPSNRDILKIAIKEIITTTKTRMTDEKISEILSRKFNRKISRVNVTVCRNQLRYSPLKNL